MASGPYPPAKNQRDKKAQCFFRDEAIHIVCRVSEKSLQRSRWDFLRRHQNFPKSYCSISAKAKISQSNQKRPIDYPLGLFNYLLEIPKRAPFEKIYK